MNILLQEVKYMSTFILTYDVKNIRIKLMLLYLLNVIDIICTLVLIHSGFYMEVNPIMVQVIHNQSASLILKVLLPALLLSYIALRINKATDHQLKISNLLINIITLVYIVINLLHFIWFLLLIFFLQFLKL